MRFRIDAAPTSKRRFRLPAHERATPPALPELDKPFKPPPWLAGGTVEANQRTIKAQVPKRDVQAQAQRTTTPKPQQAFETFAPDMDTKPLARVTMAVASEEPMPGIFGDLVLHCAPESHDMRRLSLGTMSLLRQHSDDGPIGRVLSLQHVQDRTGAWSIFGQAEIADIPRGEGDVSGAPNRGAGSASPRRS